MDLRIPNLKLSYKIGSILNEIRTPRTTMIEIGLDAEHTFGPGTF